MIYSKYMLHLRVVALSLSSVASTKCVVDLEMEVPER